MEVRKGLTVGQELVILRTQQRQWAGGGKNKVAI